MGWAGDAFHWLSGAPRDGMWGYAGTGLDIAAGTIGGVYGATPLGFAYNGASGIYDVYSAWSDPTKTWADVGNAAAWGAAGLVPFGKTLAGGAQELGGWGNSLWQAAGQEGVTKLVEAGGSYWGGSTDYGQMDYSGWSGGNPLSPGYGFGEYGSFGLDGASSSYGGGTNYGSMAGDYGSFGLGGYDTNSWGTSYGTMSDHGLGGYGTTDYGQWGQMDWNGASTGGYGDMLSPGYGFGEYGSFGLDGASSSYGGGTNYGSMAGNYGSFGLGGVDSGGWGTNVGTMNDHGLGGWDSGYDSWGGDWGGGYDSWGGGWDDFSTAGEVWY